QAMHAGQVYRFVKEVQPGDYVLTPFRATRTVLIGKAEGEYEFNPSLFGPQHPNVRRVRWLKEKSRDDFSAAARNTLGGLAAVFRADAHLAEIERLLKGEPPAGDAEVEPPLLDDVKAKADELIRDRLAKLSGHEFQDVVAAVLRAMGYVAKVGPRGKDAGVDVIAHRDPFGFSEPRIKVQVKHRAGPATRPELQALSGALHQGEYGLFVSTGGFTKDAETWADQSGKPITLKDGEAFVEMLLENYERLDPTVRALVPLRLVWIPVIE
ncbi:MAG: restriction endonuclease, partial [Chloroflexota bacterium]|nr:restriction endonuclease [Chloroflexota bacterium]